MNKFKVNVGYSLTSGRPKTRYFSSLETAKVMVGGHFARTRVVLSIEAVRSRRRRSP